jgi:hypothetical protein
VRRPGSEPFTAADWMDEGKPVTYELRAIEGLMEICDRSRTEPGDAALRMELLGALGLDPWPLRLPSGEGQVIDLRVDDARGAAQVLRGGLLATPPAFRAMVDQLAYTLANLARTLRGM